MHAKKNRKNDKIEFGSSNEDPGPVPMRVDAMVRFVHKHMQGPKFNEEEYLRRARLITGMEGFLSEEVPGNPDTTWLDELRGSVTDAQGPVISKFCERCLYFICRLLTVWFAFAHCSTRRTQEYQRETSPVQQISQKRGSERCRLRSTGVM